MIALGSHVTFTHRAAVARRKHKSNDIAGDPWYPWELTEPKTKVSSHRNGLPHVMVSVTPITFATAEELPDRPEKARYPVSEERWEKRNKTIMVWEHEGSGVVVGQVRRQFGISEPGRSYGSMWGEGDYDAGYFSVLGQLSLYVVKAELRGPEIYVPEYAIHLVHVEQS